MVFACLQMLAYTVSGLAGNPYRDDRCLNLMCSRETHVPQRIPDAEVAAGPAHQAHSHRVQAQRIVHGQYDLILRRISDAYITMRAIHQSY